MSDGQNTLAGNAGGEGGTAPVIEEKLPLGGTPAPERSLLGSDDTGTADTGADEVDWRDRIAEMGGFKDDPREMAWLRRFTKEENYHKAVPKLRREFSAGKAQQALPDDATPEEVAAYRKASGIPDKPDAYGLAFPKEWTPSDADKAGLAAFQEYAHAKHMTPAAAKTAFEFYAQSAAAAKVAQEEAVAEAKLQALAELRSEWKGSEYKRNIGIIRDFFGKGFEGHEEALDMLSGAMLPNGLRVGDSAPILKAMAAFARSRADEETLIGGDGGGGGKSLDDEYKDLIDKSATPGQKLSPSEEKRLMQIAEARASREARNGRARAA